MEISVRQIDIKPQYTRTLIANGIILVSHLSAFNPDKLARKTKLTRNECEEILNAIKPKRPHYVMKASELMIQPFEKLSSSINGLDITLGGGIRCGQVTELSGEAAAGKSNLCAQIAMLVMMSKVETESLGLAGGSDSNVLLLHTEGQGKLKLTIKRYHTLADSMATRDIISQRLHVFNCHSEFDLIEMVGRLDETLKSISKVKLIIVDSVACAFIRELSGNSSNFSQDFQFYDRRNCRLYGLMKKLMRLAWDNRLAVIVTNHVAYNSKLGETRPAMGKHWSHMCQTKIYLERKGGGHNVTRTAYVTKGAVNTPAIAQFTISDRIEI